MPLPDILSTDSLASAEMHSRFQDDFNRPPCINDLGSVFVAPDPMGIRDLMMPPFAMGGENTALLYINRKHPAAEGVTVGFTWYPDRVERRCTLDGMEIRTVTRAAVRLPGDLQADGAAFGAHVAGSAVALPLSPPGGQHARGPALRGVVGDGLERRNRLSVAPEYPESDPCRQRRTSTRLGGAAGPNRGQRRRPADCHGS